MANKPTAAANRKDTTDPASAGRIKQIRMVAGIIRKSNPRALPIVALAGIGVIAVFVVVGLLTGLLALLIPLGVAAGLMVAMIIFGRYAQSAQYKAVQGQPGPAPAAAGAEGPAAPHRPDAEAAPPPVPVAATDRWPDPAAGRPGRTADPAGGLPGDGSARPVGRPDALGVGRQVEPEQAEPSELMEQEMVGTELGQQTDVTGQQRLQFLLRQGRRGRPQSLFRHVGHSPPQFRLVHHPVADLVDRVDAHPGPLRPPASQQPNA